MGRIGIFGGSFNPVHLEHINIALIAIEKLNLDKLFVMPTFLSPHKGSIEVSAEDRLNMLKLAFSDKEKVIVSDYEIKKGGTSYTYQTAEYFRSVYKDAEIFFICGGDMLNDFRRWVYPERILKAVRLAVFGREDYFTDYKKEHEYFIKNYQTDFTEIGYVGKKFSSTRIRIYSELSLPLDNLTSEKVSDYINEKKLYQNNRFSEVLKKVLPIKRLIHTAEVVIKAESKVRELSLDKNKVETACLLHDVAKYLNPDDYSDFVLPPDVPKPVVHSFLGAYIAEKKLGVTDSEIIDAIKYHTSGKANMTTLGKLVFVADMIEDTRDYEGVEKLREVFEESLDKCFIECLKEEMEHLIKKGGPIYIETLNAFDYYVNKGEE